jgi:transcription-repair coupling factor (superfamily II helicase)
MTGTRHTGEGLDARRRKLLFRSWHRGMREMDFILGSFADAEIESLTDAEIGQYEALLEISDTELLPWITGKASMASPTATRPLRWPERRTEAAPDGPILFVARDGQRLPAIAETLAFADPRLPVLELPAWDCLPYDRVSPGSDAAARRLDALAGIIALRKSPHRAVILTTVNALLQRMPPPKSSPRRLSRKPGNQIDMNELIARLEQPASSACRPCATSANSRCAAAFWTSSRRARKRRCGSISSATRWNRSAPSTSPPSAPPASASPDAAGDERGDADAGDDQPLPPRYIEPFGAPSRDDALYAAVSEGRRFAGMEHWLPLFYERLDTLFDYLPDAPVVFDHLAHEAMSERHALILDHYEARKKQGDSALKDAVPYKPVPPGALSVGPKR